MSIRVQNPDGFPCFSGGTKDDCELTKAMLSAMESRGQLKEHGKIVADFSEASLQRSVVKNPIATCRAYHKMLEAVTTLFGVADGSQKRTSPIFSIDSDGNLVYSDEALKKGLAGGIFGAPPANFNATECSARQALHCHGLTWLALSPELLSKIAADERVWKIVAAAIESHIQGSVGLEVHLIHKANQVLRVRGPRYTFAQDPCSKTKIDRTSEEEDDEDEEEEQEEEQEESTAAPKVFSSEAIATEHGVCALTLQDHGHRFACHHSRSGLCGCRFCKASGHPVLCTACVQLNAPELVSDAKLIGDGLGLPEFCQSVKGDEFCGCTAQYPGMDDDDEAVRGALYTTATLTEPSACPPFPSGADTVLTQNLLLFISEVYHLY